MQDQTSTEATRILTVKEAGKHARLARPLITRPLRRGKLKSARAGDRGDYRIVFGDLMSWIGEGMPGLEAWTVDEQKIIVVETRARRHGDKDTLVLCDAALHGEEKAKAKVLSMWTPEMALLPTKAKAKAKGGDA